MLLLYPQESLQVVMRGVPSVPLHATVTVVPVQLAALLPLYHRRRQVFTLVNQSVNIILEGPEAGIVDEDGYALSHFLIESARIHNRDTTTVLAAIVLQKSASSANLYSGDIEARDTIQLDPASLFSGVSS